MKTYKIVFSPTGGTQKVADAITRNWPETELIDLSTQTMPALVLEKGSLALVAMPSFGGLAPQYVLDRLSQIKADHAKCVIVAVYGNRAYDDTLIQMKDYAEKAGFEVIAAISAVAEHSIVRAYAAGRPDSKDHAQLCSFGDQVLQKAEENAGSANPIKVPGNRPYKKAGGGMTPKAGGSCISCGACATSCPATAIDPANPKSTDKTKCIGCMRCISICPAKARSINPVMGKVVGLALKKACAVPKANELFL